MKVFKHHFYARAGWIQRPLAAHSVNDWLLEPASLTQRLIALGQGFHVQQIFQGKRKANFDEANVLGINPRDEVFLREVPRYLESRGHDYVIYVAEQDAGDTFDQLRERIRTGRGKIRLKDSEYLCYLILDNIVDNFIQYSHILTLEIEELELAVLNSPKAVVLNHIVRMKKRIVNFKRSIDPLKEAISSMQNDISEDNRKYYRDLYDHIVLESENIAMYRETLINLLSLYHSQLGQKTNDTMRTLTVISSIFVPLTFIAGVYGMNFKNMPELEWHNGYFYALWLMGVVGIGMFIFSIRKKWL